MGYSEEDIIPLINSYVMLDGQNWSRRNNIPKAYRLQFLELACQMTTFHPQSGGPQVVHAAGLEREKMCQHLEWQEKMFQKGLRELRSCGAITQLKPGWYQLNPDYIRYGKWDGPEYARENYIKALPYLR